MFFRLLLLTLLLASATHGKKRRSLFSPIAKSSDSQRVVKISIFNQKGIQYCSGALLSGHVVLTAAHCIYSNTLKKERPNITVETEDYLAGVKKYFLNARYKDESPCNDVALLILDQGLPTPPTPIYIGCGGKWRSDNCSAYGIGLTEHKTLSKKAREVEFKIYNSFTEMFKEDTCWETYYTTRAKLCTGDSGGPVVCNVNGKSLLVGVNVQVVSTYEGDEILTLCKLSYGSVISNYRAIIQLILQIPEYYQRLILSQIKTINC